MLKSDLDLVDAFYIELIVYCEKNFRGQNFRKFATSKTLSEKELLCFFNAVMEKRKVFSLDQFKVSVGSPCCHSVKAKDLSLTEKMEWFADLCWDLSTLKKYVTACYLSTFKIVELSNALSGFDLTPTMANELSNYTFYQDDSLAKMLSRIECVVTSFTAQHKGEPLSPGDFSCQACESLLGDVYLLSCGHKFCRKCYKEICGSSSPIYREKFTMCPTCNKLLVKTIIRRLKPDEAVSAFISRSFEALRAEGLGEDVVKKCVETSAVRGEGLRGENEAETVENVIGADIPNEGCALPGSKGLDIAGIPAYNLCKKAKVGRKRKKKLGRKGGENEITEETKGKTECEAGGESTGNGENERRCLNCKRRLEDEGDSPCCSTCQAFYKITGTSYEEERYEDDVEEEKPFYHPLFPPAGSNTEDIGWNTHVLPEGIGRDSFGRGAVRNAKENDTKLFEREFPQWENFQCQDWNGFPYGQKGLGTSEV